MKHDEIGVAHYFMFILGEWLKDEAVLVVYIIARW